MSSEASKNDASRISSFLSARSFFEEGQGQPQASSGVGPGPNLPAGKSVGREHDKQPLARQELPPAEGNDAVPMSELLAMVEMVAKTESAEQPVAPLMRAVSAAAAAAAMGANVAPSVAPAPAPPAAADRSAEEGLQKRSAAGSQAPVLDIADLLDNAEIGGMTLEDLEASLASPVINTPPSMHRPGTTVSRGLGLLPGNRAGAGAGVGATPPSVGLADVLAKADETVGGEHEKGLLFRQVPRPSAAVTSLPMISTMPTNSLSGGGELDDEKAESVSDPVIMRAGTQSVKKMSSEESPEKLLAASIAASIDDDEAKARCRAIDAGQSGESMTLDREGWDVGSGIFEGGRGRISSSPFRAENSGVRSSIDQSKHSCLSLCGRLPETANDEDEAPGRARLTSEALAKIGPVSPPFGSVESPSGAVPDENGRHATFGKSADSFGSAPEFLRSGTVPPPFTMSPLVPARSGRRPQVKEAVRRAAIRPVKEEKITQAETGGLPRPRMAPTRKKLSNCRNCGADTRIPPPDLTNGSRAQCWLCGKEVTCSRQTRRCQSAASSCVSASRYFSVKLVFACSVSGVVMSTPKTIHASINKEWEELVRECSKLVGARCRNQSADLTSFLGVYFLSQASQSSVYWDEAKMLGNPEGRTFIALKEWGGVSSVEEFLVKNTVSTFLETALYSPSDVRDAELVAASWGCSRVARVTHSELVGMSAELVSSAIGEDASSSSRPCLVALGNLSRLLNTGSVALVSRSAGDWGDLTCHGNGPKGHELLAALLFRVKKEMVESTTVLVVTAMPNGQRAGAMLTAGVFDKQTVTVGDIQRVVKDLTLVEHWGPIVEGSPSLATIANLAKGGDTKWRPARPGYHEAVASWIVGSSMLRMFVGFFCLSGTALYAFAYDKGTSHTLAALLLLDLLRRDLGVPLWVYAPGDDVRLSRALAAAPGCHWLMVVSMGSVEVAYSADFQYAGLFAIAVSSFWSSLLLLNLIKVVALDRACRRSGVSRRNIRQRDHGLWKKVLGKGIYTDTCCGDGRLLSVSWLKFAEGDLWLTRNTVIGHTERWPPPVAVRKAQIVGTISDKRFVEHLRSLSFT